MQQPRSNPKKLGTGSLMSESWVSQDCKQSWTWSSIYQNVMKPVLSVKLRKGTGRKMTTEPIRFLALLSTELTLEPLCLQMSVAGEEDK